MDFAFTQEHSELRRTVRDLLRKSAAEAEVRRLMETEEGFDPAAWRTLAGDLGVAGLAVPEEYGGAGCGFVELGIVMEEAGRSLVCAPLLSTVVLAASALLELGDDAACREYLPEIATGATTATLALTEPSGRWDAGGIEATARRGAVGWTIEGTKSFVPDGHSAALLLVAARTNSGISLFVVEAGAPGLSREPQATLDRTRKQAVIGLGGTPARLIGREGAAWPALARVLDLAAVAVAAEQAGGAARVLEMGAEYAKTRVQFGRPIGSFQAVKHKLADVHIGVEAARSAAYHGMWTAAGDPSGLPSAASLAKAYCGDVFVRAATENVHVHGGIGVTWEHPAQLYLKRAHGSQSYFGDPVYHRARFARLVLADVPA